jgi:hypothetical protein
VVARDGPLARDRVDAVVGERRRHDREVTAIHRDRTLAKVDLDDGHRIVFEDVEVAEHVPDRTVAMARAALRFVHG